MSKEELTEHNPLTHIKVRVQTLPDVGTNDYDLIKQMLRTPYETIVEQRNQTNQVNSNKD